MSLKQKQTLLKSKMICKLVSPPLVVKGIMP